MCYGITQFLVLFLLDVTLHMMTSPNGIFSALLAICAGNSLVTGDFPTQRPVMWGFDVFFDLHLNKRLSKQSWGWWFETPSHPLWRHCNDKSKAWHVTGPIWRKPMATGQFPSQRASNVSFDAFYDINLNCWTNNQSAGDVMLMSRHCNTQQDHPP